MEKKEEVSVNMINISSLIARPKNLTRLTDKNIGKYIGVLLTIVWHERFQCKGVPPQRGYTVFLQRRGETENVQTKQSGVKKLFLQIDGEQESVATTGERKASDGQFVQSSILRTRKV